MLSGLKISSLDFRAGSLVPHRDQKGSLVSKMGCSQQGPLKNGHLYHSCLHMAILWQGWRVQISLGNETPSMWLLKSRQTWGKDTVAISTQDMTECPVTPTPFISSQGKIENVCLLWGWRLNGSEAVLTRNVAMGHHGCKVKTVCFGGWEIPSFILNKFP